MRRATYGLAVLASACVATWMLTPSHEPAEPEAEAWAPIEIELAALEPPPPPPKEKGPPPRPRPQPPEIPAIESESAESAESESASPDPAVLSRGRELLESGVFPQLRATYRRIGFEAYRDAMLDLGGGFFLFDEVSRQPLAEIDPRTGETRSRELRDGLSRWPRDVTRHLPEVLELGRRRWGERASRVILLPPERVDAVLLGALDAHLREQGRAGERLLGVDVASEIRDGRLGCEVISLSLLDGTRQPVRLHIDLGRGASG